MRRCFLFGVDPVTGINLDSRKVWIENQLKLLAASFGIDLLAFAILANHFHLIVRSRLGIVETWDDSEVARRWRVLCPKRKNKDRSSEEPNDFELNSIRNDPDKLATIRKWLSDVAWWIDTRNRKGARTTQLTFCCPRAALPLRSVEHSGCSLGPLCRTNHRTEQWSHSTAWQLVETGVTPRPLVTPKRSFT